MGSGCPLAANGSELVRVDATTRHNATEALRIWFEKAAPFMRSPDAKGKTELAISVVTNMIGALTMSRMVDDPDLSAQILEATRRHIANAFDLSSSKRRDAPRALHPQKKRTRSKVQ